MSKYAQKNFKKKEISVDFEPREVESALLHSARVFADRWTFGMKIILRPFMTTSINDILLFDNIDVQGLDHVLILNHVELGLNHNFFNSCHHS